MRINGKVHCFFEQSGTFKNEFIKLGIPAEDYDIQNNFGETDHQDDLFKAIEDAYEGKPSLFDSIVGGKMETLFWRFFLAYTFAMLQPTYSGIAIKITANCQSGKRQTKSFKGERIGSISFRC